MFFPDLSLVGVLSRYRKKFFFGNAAAARPQPKRLSKINTQNMTNIERNLRIGNLDGSKSVQCYPAYMEI